MNGSASLVRDHILASLVPVQPGQSRSVSRTCGCALVQLTLAQCRQCGDQLAVERQSALAVMRLGLFDADPVLNEHPCLVDG